MTAPVPCPPEQVVWLYVADNAEVSDEERAHITGCAQCQGRTRLLGPLQAVLTAAAAPFANQPPLPGPLQGRYAFLRCLARGGFGEVWLAQDNVMQRQVAIKTLRSSRDHSEALAALRNEMRLLVELTARRSARRHLVQVHDWVEEAGRSFFLMEHVQGGSLGERVKRFGPLTWGAATRYVADVGEALLEVHARNIIHRDIKPDNVLWDDDTDEALLTDFGIAALVGADGLGGTAGYIAPELRYGPCSPASDVFGLAATLYHLLTGRAPFAAATIDESLDLAERGLPAPDPALGRAPAAIAATIRGGLHPDPEARLSLERFLSALRGSGAQALAQSLLASSVPQPPVANALDLTLEVHVNGQPAQPAPPVVHRDLDDVPPEPGCPPLRTGSELSFHFSSRSGGYLTLLNVGSSGKVTIVFPNQQAPDNHVQPGGQRRITIRLTPPSGTDEAIGILTRAPAALLPEEWQTLVREGRPVVDAYRSYRDLAFLAEQVPRASPVEWKAVGVKIVHS